MIRWVKIFTKRRVWPVRVDVIIKHQKKLKKKKNSEVFVTVPCLSSPGVRGQGWCSPKEGIREDPPKFGAQHSRGVRCSAQLCILSSVIDC